MEQDPKIDNRSGLGVDRDADIVCRQVRKVYNANGKLLEAVRRVDFSVADGEFVSLLGPSGCGKSTLLMMIGGIESITSGEIFAGGEPVTGPRREFGIMLQDPTLLPWKSAMDNVMFPIDMMRLSRRRYMDRAFELLQTIGLAGFERSKPRELSGGMRQRVAICRALISDPRVLLMDEPFSALDAMTRDEMNILMLDLWETYRKTAIFVTHSIREAVLLSDRVLVMRDRPSTIISDTSIPFQRPRSIGLGETQEFNEICAMLRDQIEVARTDGDGRTPGALAEGGAGS